MDFSKISQAIKMIGGAGLGAPLIILMILAMVVLPLPPFVLDLFFTFNIAFALIILLVVIYVKAGFECRFDADCAARRA